MKMNFIKGGLAALVLGVAALNSGCAISAGYKDSMERVDCTFVGAPTVGAGNIKHILYKKGGKEIPECEFNSFVSGSLLTGGSYEMKIYGDKKDLLWEYRIEADTDKNYRLRIKDSFGNQSNWESAIPPYFPSNVQVEMEGSSLSDLSGMIYYSNLQGIRVNPRLLLSDEAKAFVKEKVKAQ